MKQAHNHILSLIACIFVAELIVDGCAFQPRSTVRQNDKIRSSSSSRRSSSTVLKRPWSLYHSSPQNKESFDDDNSSTKNDEVQRRRFLQQCCSAILTAPVLVAASQSANAFGLVQFPCERPLLNTYHFMAAGQNLLEEEDIISTNPLFLTNREAALSPKGIAQVQEACLFLEQNQINPSVVKYSLAASSMDTTAIVKDALRVGQNRLIPEFTFMDPRGIGKWDTMSYSQTLPAIFALDETEAGKDGKQGRPPPNDDGTPNETLAEQKIRLVQLISVLETQFQGDTVLLIFPDGSTPALLSCMMAGIPFNKVHELEFAPGEVRLHQDMANIQRLYETRQQQSALNREYEKTVQLGKVELERLRGLDPATIVSKKDLKLQKEVAEVEEQQRQRDEQRRIKAEKEEEARILRYKTIEEARAKKEQAAALQRMSQSGGASEGGDKSTQIAIGSVTSLAVVAGLAIGGQSDTDPVAAVSSGSAAMRNETFAGPLNATTTTTTSGVQSATRAAATANAPTRASNATTRVQSLPDTLPQTILPVGDAAASNKKSLYSDPVPTKENKEEAAAKAMEDYMNQDDGGDDWLTVMGQLMEEDETGEDGQDIIDEWQ